MRRPPPLVLAGAMLLMLSSALAAQPSCEAQKFTTQPSGSAKGQAVRDAAGLGAALENAKGGETFILAPGNYGGLSLGKTYNAAVTIRSANPAAPACFSDLRLKGAGNVTFDGVVFDYSYSPGEKDFANRFSILQSRNITISGSLFDGDHNRTVGHGRGLRIRDSASITVTGSVFRKWWKALTGGKNTNLTIRGNEFYDIRSDGMTLGVTDGLMIAANRLHNFRGAPGRDHRDMLQITRSSNQRSTNIVIRDNVFDMGAGDYSQTIWMGGDGKNLGDPMLRHQNVLIENNVIYNAHTHGISVHAIDGLSIRRNSLIRVHRAEKGNVTIPRINVSRGSTSVVIEQNATSGIIGYHNQRDWVILNNAIIQDTSPGARGFYDRQFIYYATGATHGYHEYGVRPGSLIAKLNAGSTLVKNYPTRR